MTTEYIKIKMEKEFRVCPNCGYEDGFHNKFGRSGEGEGLSWKLICPNCHKIFNLGLKTNINN